MFNEYYVLGGHLGLSGLNIKFISKYIAYDILTGSYLSLKLFMFVLFVDIELYSVTNWHVSL